MEPSEEVLREMHDALVRLDELSLMLGHTLATTRIGWEDPAECEDVLGPINQIAKKIGEAIPQLIKAVRPQNKWRSW